MGGGPPHGGPEEDAALARLRQRLAEAGLADAVPPPSMCCPPGDEETTLRRFLRARQCRVDAAYEMLVASARWRQRENIDSVVERLPAGAARAELFRCYPHGFHGFDVEHRPVYIQQSCKIDVPALLDRFTMEQLVESHLVNMEYQSRVLCGEATRRAGRPLHKTCNILDMDGMGPGWFFGKAIELVKRSSAVDQDNYPEMLGVAYLVNAPGVFVLVWNIISKFLDPATRAKVRFLGNVRGRAAHDELVTVLGGEDKLPRFLGGACACGGCITGPGEGCSGSAPSNGHAEMLAYVASHGGSIPTPAACRPCAGPGAASTSRAAGAARPDSAAPGAGAEPASVPLCRGRRPTCCGLL